MFVLKIVALCLFLAVAVLFFTLYRNDAHLFEEPGMKKRLTTFFTTNVAETKDEHAFKELRTPVFSMSAEKTYQRVLDAAAELGWVVESHDSDNQNATFVVASPVFLFKDDVFVQVQFINMDQSSLYVRSSSRKGRGDMAANSSHIQRLINKLK